MAQPNGQFLEAAQRQAAFVGRDSCPGHTIWKRDFSGRADCFPLSFARNSVESRCAPSWMSLICLRLDSWAVTTSLAVAYILNHVRGASSYGDRLVRLSIGMKETDDLVADLEQAQQAHEMMSHSK